MTFPNARHHLIKNKTTGKDPLVDKLLEGEFVEEYKHALAIYNSPIKKSYVEACMMASENITEIEDMLEIAYPILDIYRQVFFDVRGYNKLDKLEILELSDNDDEKSMKLWALSQGMGFISWRLGRNPVINPVSGLQDMFSTCVYKSKEAMFSGNVSASSVESTKWVKLSMDLARILKQWTTDSSAARQDIELALRDVIPDFKGFDDLD